MENFADPDIGCVSGQLMLGDPESGESSTGLGLYWRIEKRIRELEASTGSVIGATGALYAARRDLIPTLPGETILDDVYIPMHILKTGARVTFDPRACAWDVPDHGRQREFSRKVRTLSGNFQLLQLAPWLLSNENPARFGFVSHKLLRLIVPLALLADLGTAALLREPIYRFALVLQLAFYILGVWALLRPRRNFLPRIADVASTFVLLNTAALVALANFLAGRKPVWAP